MIKIELENNLKEIIDLYNNLQSSVHDLLRWVNEEGSQRVMLDDFLDFVWIDISEETRYAAYARISNLKEEPLVLYLDNQWVSDDYKNKKLDLAYKFVCDFYSEIQAVIISVIDSKKLLTPFYLEIFKWIANVWLAFNELFIPWRNHIVNTVNKDLENRFNNDSNMIMDYLNENNLLDLWHNNELADRSYSALVLENDEYVSKSYFEVFNSEIKTIVDELDIFIENLSVLEDEIYDSKEQYIDYLNAIKNALVETNVNKLVEKWSFVDEAWMQIKTPFQIWHPLEFYEDKYRKAVAPEWDLRIKNTVFDSKIESSISDMYEKIFDWLDKQKYSSSYEFSKANLNRVQFYLSTPVLYYSSELTWLFSAQVVPNDEIVSKQFWKKIFAFPEMVLKNKRSNPLMKMDGIVFEESLLKKYRNSVFGKDEVFYKIYDILTIWHEYWHNLWLDSDTQHMMNKKTGVYKKIEEFKATTGWLMAYFYNENIAIDLKEIIIINHIYRCTNLLKYREVNELEPYYCEALIHIYILFESGIISINDDKKICVNFDDEVYKNLKTVYENHYKKMIIIYLDKSDAWEFLSDYVLKKDWFYLPKDEKILEYVEYFYDLYKKIGNEME